MKRCKQCGGRLSIGRKHDEFCSASCKVEWEEDPQNQHGRMNGHALDYPVTQAEPRRTGIWGRSPRH